MHVPMGSICMPPAAPQGIQLDCRTGMFNDHDPAACVPQAYDDGPAGAPSVLRSRLPPPRWLNKANWGPLAYSAQHSFRLSMGAPAASRHHLDWHPRPALIGSAWSDSPARAGPRQLSLGSACETSVMLHWKRRRGANGSPRHADIRVPPVRGRLVGAPPEHAARSTQHRAWSEAWCESRGARVWGGVS